LAAFAIYKFGESGVLVGYRITGVHGSSIRSSGWKCRNQQLGFIGDYAISSAFRQADH
jgi:hypothetical protein